MIITIDGPTGSGKSTIAAQLAQKLGYYYLNTGFLYRAISYLLITRYGYTLEQLKHPTNADLQEILDPSRFQYTYHAGVAGVLYDGVSLTPFLKNKENDQASSIVSGNPMVRKALLEYQRNFAKQFNVVTEGRDTGSVVFPEAEVKVFLTADSAVRAQRWQSMQEARGKLYSLEQALQEIEQRDLRDSSRDIAPLSVPNGATVVDSTHLTESQVITRIMALIP